jgi:hypothetical protein
MSLYLILAPSEQLVWTILDKYGPAWDGILLELGNYCTPDVVDTCGSKYPPQSSFYFLFGVTMSVHDSKLPTET